VNAAMRLQGCIAVFTRTDVDRKFIWMMGIQIAALVAIMSAMAKLVHLF
jgi:hypothetical protein